MASDARLFQRGAFGRIGTAFDNARSRVTGLSVDDLKSAIRGVSPETAITFAVVLGAMVFVFLQLQPSLLFANTTPAGGDTGAHVWGPDYMRDHLLPNGRITGWAPDWYAGFPAYHFYFPLPALFVVLLDFVMPYGVALKLVSISGLVTLPLAAWAFGRLSGMRFPGPPLLAVASLLFLFDRGFTIYGGNIASTLAGEFSFSISLSLAMVFLGLVARGLDNGRNQGLAAVVLALTGLSHLLPTIFAVVGALLILALRPGWRRLRFATTMLGVGALLAAFWSFPFLMRLDYINNMGWEKITGYSTNLFPTKILWVLLLAGVGAYLGVVNRRRSGMFFTAMAVLAGLLFVLAPPGRLWNARVLPFYYLSVYMLAGFAVAELGPVVGRWLSVDPDRPSRLGARVTPVAAGLVVLFVLALPLQVLPGWMPKPETQDRSFIPGWAKWNYSGYEGKAAYPEYKSVIDMMSGLGRTNGCGRTHWEYDGNLDRFGTPMALMLLPYWTDGCIGSMEGLYFESAATTPYHFLTAGELSKGASNPQRDLPYRPFDLDEGIRHLKMLGARYYLAFSPEATAAADVHPDLTLRASTGAWRAYEVRGSQIVEGLAYEPAVMTGVADGEHGWRDVAVDWFQDKGGADVFLAATGPDEWQRVAVTEVATNSKTSGSSVRIGSPARKSVTPAVATRIRTSDNRISFDVDRVGSPVLVKASYFPNWKASGAQGPWRVAPNLMVVIPTSNHVSLHYGWTAPDILGWILSLVGAGIAITWARRGPADVDAARGRPKIVERLAAWPGWERLRRRDPDDGDDTGAAPGPEPHRAPDPEPALA